VVKPSGPRFQVGFARDAVSAVVSSIAITIENNSGSFNWARTHQYPGGRIEALAVDGLTCALIHLKSSGSGYGQQTTPEQILHLRAIDYREEGTLRVTSSC
jgi:hypothetical protein